METRKAIIELIEPYMDKTLSEGCLFCEKFHWSNSEDLVWNNIISRYEKGNVDLTHYVADYSEGTHLHYISTNELLNLRQYKHGDTHKQDGEKVYKILGHYDITAVLKYIDSISDLGDIETYFSQDQINITASLWVESGTNYVDIEIDIPNKPLHLYTEQEEQDLLKLLQKINGNTTT